MLHRSEMYFLWNRFHARHFEAMEFRVAQFGMRLLQHTKNRLAIATRNDAAMVCAHAFGSGQEANTLIIRALEIIGIHSSCLRADEADVG